MAGKIAMFVASVLGVGTVSGVALGQYATTTKQPVVDASEVLDSTGSSTSRDAAYQSVSAASDLDMAPAHIPICRKGCGQSLSERQAKAYYSSSSAPLDRIYADSGESYPDTSLPSEPVISETDPISVSAPPPRLTLGGEESPCTEGDCDGPAPVGMN